MLDALFECCLSLVVFAALINYNFGDFIKFLPRVMGVGISPIFLGNQNPGLADPRDPFGEQRSWAVRETRRVLNELKPLERLLLAADQLNTRIGDNFYLANPSLVEPNNQVFLSVSGAPANGKEHILDQLDALLATQLHPSLYLYEPKGRDVEFASQIKQAMRRKGLIGSSPDDSDNIFMSNISINIYNESARDFAWVVTKKDWKSLFTLSLLEDPGEDEIISLIDTLGLREVFLDAYSLQECVNYCGVDHLELLYLQLAENFLKHLERSALGLSLSTMPIPLTFLVNRRPASTFKILEQEEHGLRTNTRRSPRPFFTGWTLNKLICCRAIDTILLHRFPHIFLEINQEDYDYPSPEDQENWDRYWARKIAKTAQKMVVAYGGNPLTVSTTSVC